MDLDLNPEEDPDQNQKESLDPDLSQMVSDWHTDLMVYQTIF